MEYKYIARKWKNSAQSLEEHLQNVSDICRRNADSIGLGEAGALLGYVHDIAKASTYFNNLIKSDSTYKRDEEPVDHSTGGGQWLADNLDWRQYPQKVRSDEDAHVGFAFLREMLPLAAVGHHSGLMDVISADGFDNLSERLGRLRINGGTNLDSALRNIAKSGASSSEKKIIKKLKELVAELPQSAKVLGQKRASALSKDSGLSPAEAASRNAFYMGMTARFLAGCLIDADWTDAGNFASERKRNARAGGRYVEWETLLERLEYHLSVKPKRGRINTARRIVRDKCRKAGAMPRGQFTLSAPTGTGKTLASLEFGLVQAVKSAAEKHPIRHIIIVLPYTSIIEQNAQRIRECLETGYEQPGSVLLECHSNLAADKRTVLSDILTENWDAPVIITTQVQFMNALFSSEMKHLRRMSAIASSVVIFDEVQTMPIRLAGQFCLAVNAMTDMLNCSVLFSTATMPNFQGAGIWGALRPGNDNPTFEINTDGQVLYDRIQRVRYVDATRSGGYSAEELARFIQDKQIKNKRVLCIVNTTKMAREVWLRVKELYAGTNVPVMHFSAHMCPAHRTEALKDMYKVLEKTNKHGRRIKTPLPAICISTQVMEAGIDVDYNCVIRALAGFDSIVQAAGRDNREGKLPMAELYIVNTNEQLGYLRDIANAKNVALGIMSDITKLGGDIITLDSISLYFKKFYGKYGFETRNPIYTTRRDNMVNLLSLNNLVPARNNVQRLMRQAFRTAGDNFNVIDAPTAGVITPWGEGANLAEKLTSINMEDLQAMKELQRDIQPYIVNIYDTQLSKLAAAGMIKCIELSDGYTKYWMLREEAYDKDTGFFIES